jgi:choline monooxygenase
VWREAELGSAGSWRSLTLAGRPVGLVSRGDAAPVAWRDACLHRGAQLLRTAQGQLDAAGELRCAYHGLRYDGEGRLEHCPHPESFPDGPRVGSDRLPPVAVGRALGWIWLRTAAQGPELATFLGEELLAELAPYDLASAALVERSETEVACGWKVAVEAFLEAWHLPTVHPRTAAPLVDHRLGSMRALGDHSRMVNAFRSPRAFEPDGPLGAAAAAHGVANFPGLVPVQRRTNGSYLLFPSSILSLLPNHLAHFRIEPLAVDRCRLVAELLAAPSDDPRAAAWRRSLVSGYRQLLAEDLENLPWIQSGLRSAERLRRSHFDRRVGHFQARVRHWLGADPTAP